MIPVVVILLIAWLVVVLFYAYVRCTATVENNPGRVVAMAAGGGGGNRSRGLDPAVVNAIPTFAYESKTEGVPLECAICLSQFEDGETGRVMPECRHSFHVGCIDMWLQSHCDCPLCRNRVKVPGMGDPVRPVENSQDGAVSVHIRDPCPGSGWISALPLFLFAL